MSYASSLGRTVGKQVRKRPAQKLGQSVGSYATPGSRVGGTVGSYPGAQAGKAIGTTVGAAPSAAPTPGGGAAVGGGAPAPGASLGGDAGLLSAQDQAQRATGLADARYQYTVNGLGSEYGLDAQGGVDTNNPYGRAALMQHMATNQRRGTQNSYAAQGQLYSGALQNAQDENARQENIGFDQLQKGYLGGVAGAGLDRSAAYSAATDTVSAAQLAALLRAIGGSS